VAIISSEEGEKLIARRVVNVEMAKLFQNSSNFEMRCPRNTISGTTPYRSKWINPLRNEMIVLNNVEVIPALVIAYHQTSK
jgi:hypothetical protein